MKTYDQLTEDQQAKAVSYHLTQLMKAITEGLRFNDEANNDDLQARIDAAGEKAESMQTPWFWTSYIMDTCADDLTAMAQADSEDALYSEDDDSPVVPLSELS